MTEVKKVFIVGVPRSGTTLLATILENHKDIYLEPRAIGPSIIRVLDNALDWYESHSHRIFNLERFIHEGVTSLPRVKNFVNLQGKEKTNFIKILDDSIKGKIKLLNKNVWLDKCPPMVTEIPKLKFYMPDAKFIHVIRDGRAVALSLRKRQYMNLIIAANYWKMGVLKGKSYGFVLGGKDYMEVRYEDLINKPKQTISKVLNFLDLEFYDDILNLSKNPVTGAQNSYVGKEFDVYKMKKWKTELTELELLRIESMVGDILISLGYELEVYKGNKFKSISPWLRLWLMLSDQFKYILRKKSKAMVDRRIVEIYLPFKLRLRKGLGNILNLFFSDEVMDLLKHIIK